MACRLILLRESNWDGRTSRIAGAMMTRPYCLTVMGLAMCTGDSVSGICGDVVAEEIRHCAQRGLIDCGLCQEWARASDATE